LTGKTDIWPDEKAVPALTVIEEEFQPDVSVHPGGIDQIYPVARETGSTEYSTFCCPHVISVGPDINPAALGGLLTVISNDPCGNEKHPLVSPVLTESVYIPGWFHITVTSWSANPPPETMVPPVGKAHT
jgi:hypothetical protein